MSPDEDGLPELDDPLWDALAEDELDEEERAALAALAGEEGEERVAAFEPLDEAYRERLAGALTAKVRAEAEAEPSAATAPRRWVGALVVGLAAAAALLLVVRPFGGPEAWPSYRLEVHGGAAEERAEGVEAAEAIFLPETRVELVFRPLEPLSEPLSEPVPVRAFLRAPGGELEAWDAPLERAPGGAVRVAGTAASLFGARRGPIEVFFVLGDTAEGDAAEGDAAEGGEPDPDAPHVHRVVIQVEDAPVEDAPVEDAPVEGAP